MAQRTFRIFRKSYNVFYHNKATLVSFKQDGNISKIKYRTEENYAYLADPDVFGTLSKKSSIPENSLNDEGDVQEMKFLENKPLKSQKLTIKQYADLIKQYIQHKRLKEAFDVLETRMLTQDRVKPENYIYNILIGACAEVGYTKKAFKLFNDMKKRALKPTGDTYTCLFHACANSPWPKDGLKNAQNLRELILEKGIELNLTNYNSMIKAFGRCGDLKTAFKIVDEMISKKIKIRVHTFNHLLHACITDKTSGLRHALVIWRKMLKAREKPNIYSFNLMLKCVKECDLGTKEDIEQLIAITGQNFTIIDNLPKPLEIGAAEPYEISSREDIIQSHSSILKENNKTDFSTNMNVENEGLANIDPKSAAISVRNEDFGLVNIVNNKPLPISTNRTVPNLLSKEVKVQKIIALQEISSVQDKFAIIGGQEDFLREMDTYSVKPDIKTFTQMLFLIDNTTEAELKLLETMKSLDIKPDIDFYNMLIKKRCLRTDYNSAFEVKEMIEKDKNYRKKKFFFKKKIRLNENIMTYGVLAMACKTKESAEKLLKEMQEKQIKVNIEILGTLLRNGIVHTQFDYILYIIDKVKEENINVNDIFIKHLQSFNEKCTQRLQQENCSERFIRGYNKFSKIYNYWIKELNVDELLRPEHPWNQFKSPHPQTVQRQNINIEEPKKFYPRSRKFIKYRAKI